jgi:hypothetical protein
LSGSQQERAATPPRFFPLVMAVYRARAPPWENPPAQEGEECHIRSENMKGSRVSSINQSTFKETHLDINLYSLERVALKNNVPPAWSTDMRRKGREKNQGKCGKEKENRNNL